MVCQLFLASPSRSNASQAVSIRFVAITGGLIRLIPHFQTQQFEKPWAMVNLHGINGLWSSISCWESFQGSFLLEKELFNCSEGWMTDQLLQKTCPMF